MDSVKLGVTLDDVTVLRIVASFSNGITTPHAANLREVLNRMESGALTGNEVVRLIQEAKPDVSSDDSDNNFGIEVTFDSGRLSIVGNYAGEITAVRESDSRPFSLEATGAEIGELVAQIRVDLLREKKWWLGPGGVLMDLDELLTAARDSD